MEEAGVEVEAEEDDFDDGNSVFPFSQCSVKTAGKIILEAIFPIFPQN
jgi:hypothetical protein